MLGRRQDEDKELELGWNEVLNYVAGHVLEQVRGEVLYNLPTAAQVHIAVKPVMQATVGVTSRKSYRKIIAGVAFSTVFRKKVTYFWPKY